MSCQRTNRLSADFVDPTCFRQRCVALRIKNGSQFFSNILFSCSKNSKNSKRTSSFHVARQLAQNFEDTMPKSSLLKLSLSKEALKYFPLDLFKKYLEYNAFLQVIVIQMATIKNIFILHLPFFNLP